MQFNIFASRSSFNMGGLFLPPHPTSNKLGADARKGMKGFSVQGDVHSLKFLYNHQLQWRFANAKAEASMHYQRHESQSKLYSFVQQLSDLCKSVSQKHAEFGVLRRIKTLSTIVESKLSCLDEWSNLEEDYSTSLSGTTDTLRIFSLRLSIGTEVHVDIKELGDALSSYTKVMEMIGLQIQNFMQKAEETESLFSELFRVIGGEKTLIEEWGDLLMKTYLAGDRMEFTGADDSNALEQPLSSSERMKILVTVVEKYSR